MIYMTLGVIDLVLLATLAAARREREFVVCLDGRKAKKAK
jgi:hypothetical protein